MKILIVAPYFPFPPQAGGAIRVYNHLRLLAAHHDLFLAYPHSADITPTALQEAQSFCRRLLPFSTAPLSYSGFDLRRLRAYRSLSSSRPLIWRELTPRLNQAVAAILKGLNGVQPDLIHAHQFHTAEVALALKHNWGTRTKLLLDEHNVESHIWSHLAATSARPDRRLVFNREVCKLEKALRQIYPWCDAVTTVSHDDKNALAKLTGRHDLILLPNGVDTTFFQRTTPPVPNSNEILFTGTLGYEPNLDGLLYFYNQIWPLIQSARPQTRLLIVGRHAPPIIRALHNGTSIQVIGPVADMRPYYERARVCIVPLRWGGGTRLKILEALAMQVPIVSTTAGVSGLNVTLGDHYLVGDSPESFANLTLRLLDIKGPARHLALAGRKLVETQYEWIQIMATLGNLYTTLTPAS